MYDEESFTSTFSEFWPSLNKDSTKEEAFKLYLVMFRQVTNFFLVLSDGQGFYPWGCN